MQFNTLDSVLNWRAELPHEHLAVTFGFNRGEIEAHPAFGAASGEPVIVAAPGARDPGDIPTATFLARDPIVHCSDITSQVRKSLIRAALRNRIEVRIPRSGQELSGYFSLRYRVWKAEGYLREENREVSPEWEIDFWDRTAVPLCAIARDGKVVGCARLISSHGDEEPTYVARISDAPGSGQECET